MKTTLPPCAADALFGIRTITVNGRTVGIARLCDAIADVRAMGLTGNEPLKAALVARVGKDNYIPEKLSGEYAEALLAEYHRAGGDDHGR